MSTGRASSGGAARASSAPGFTRSRSGSGRCLSEVSMSRAISSTLRTPRRPWPHCSTRGKATSSTSAPGRQRRCWRSSPTFARPSAPRSKPRWDPLQSIIPWSTFPLRTSTRLAFGPKRTGARKRLSPTASSRPGRGRPSTGGLSRNCARSSSAFSLPRIDPPTIEHSLATDLADPPLERFVRRMLDIGLSAVALALTWPVIALAALIVRLDTAGPSFFRQTRLGKHGRRFTIVKLRGMYADARERFAHLYNYELSDEEARRFHFHIEDDPRVTRVGHFFRKTSIDELPNFWNVLKGDMSLVGPRPQIPEMFPYYGPYKDVILSVRPGIFSLPKVSNRDDANLQETILADAYYVHHRSLGLDFKIILRGIAMVVLRRAVR